MRIRYLVLLSILIISISELVTHIYHLDKNLEVTFAYTLIFLITSIYELILLETKKWDWSIFITWLFITPILTIALYKVFVLCGLGSMDIVFRFTVLFIFCLFSIGLLGIKILFFTSIKNITYSDHLSKK
jgi:hypothetical protein